MVGNWRLLVVTMLTVMAALSSTITVYAQAAPLRWTLPVNFSQQPETVSYAPQVLCDRYQNVHIFWLERDDQSATLFYRNDREGVWSQAFDIIIAKAIANFSIAVDSDDVLHLVYLDRARNGVLYYTAAPLYYAWNAQYWMRPVALASEVAAGDIEIDDHDNLRVTFTQADEDGLSHSTSYISSSDQGETWDDPVLFHSTTTPIPSVVSAKITADGAGRLHVAWNERSFEYGAHSRLGYMRSSDGGKTWDIDEVLAESNTPPGVAVLDLTIFGEDEIHLTWDQPERLHKWSGDGGDTWTEPQVIIPLGAAFGGVNALAKDSSERMHAVAAVGNGVYDVPWNGNTWGAADTIDDRFIDAHGQLITTCQGNRLHVVYYDRIGEQELWYSTKEVNSPKFPQSAMPEPQASNIAFRVSPTPTVSANNEQRFAIRPTLLPPELSQVQAPPSQALATVGSISLTIVVIGLVVLVNKHKRWSR